MSRALTFRGDILHLAGFGARILLADRIQHEHHPTELGEHVGMTPAGQP